jgi:hypothetical protein
MIPRLFFDALFGFVSFVTNALPSGGPPAWLGDVDGYFAQIWTAGAGLGAWVPWTLVGTIFAAVITSMFAGFTIKVIRVIASFFTGGGGSAA